MKLRLAQRHARRSASPRGDSLPAARRRSVKNIGDTAALVQYLAANVYGLKFADRTATYASQGGRSRALPVEGKHLILSYAFSGPAFGGSAFSFYQPGREKLNRRFIAVRQGDYDAVSVQWEVCYSCLDFTGVVRYRFRSARDGTVQTSLPGPQIDLAARHITCALGSNDANAEAL